MFNKKKINVIVNHFFSTLFWLADNWAPTIIWWIISGEVKKKIERKHQWIKKQISNCYLRMDPDLISQLSNHYQNCTGRGIVLNLMWYFWGVPKKWNE